ncbi:MAG: AAA family ATPase [Pirellulaceae bacterium]
MNVIQEIATWARALPAWQSDAVRRIFTKDKLSAEDEGQIYEILLDAHGLSEPNATVPAPSPFSDVVGPTIPGCRTVVLKEIHSLENVNALVPGQSMKFGLSGITVIFGENGAGKSGYARVFKHACLAREKSEPLHSNVLKPTNAKPAATVELLVNDQDVAVRWRSGSPASELLLELSVFDSHCARVFIDEANEVVYLPYGIDTFSRLATLCTRLKERIVAESRNIPEQFGPVKEYSEVTVVGRFVRSLTSNSDEAQIGLLSAIDNAGIARVNELREIVLSAKTNSPKLKAAQIRRTKGRFEQIKVGVSSVANTLSSDSLLQVAQLQAHALAATKAAELASSDAFSNDPLKVTGSEPWRVLFDAARRFSESSAYPNEAFPVIHEGAVCLLCQQPLTETAGDRLTRFETFVKEDAVKRKDDAVAALGRSAKLILDLKVTPLEDDPSLIEELRAFDAALADVVATFYSQAKARRASVVAALAESTPAASFETLSSPSEQLSAAIIALESQAQQYDDAHKPEEVMKLSAELVELEDRMRLKSHSELVKAYIKQKKRRANLKRCDKALDTSSITRRGSELMEQAVTEQLSANLTAELKRFGLKCVPVQIKKTGQKGKTRHQLVVSDLAKASGVLSEGEQRVIAIASFLAELRTGKSQAPIVFDDPVSSLDHVYRERVARRLVEEAKSRQVVVFTHDVVLLLALEREAGEQQTPLLIQTVSKSPAGPGECIPSQSRPWYTCSTKDRIGLLKNMTAKFKKIQTESPDEYPRCVAEFYGKLREAWERSIEEVLFQDVIQRFRPGIETQKLKRVSIEESDYIAIDSGMSKCSTWIDGHDSAAAIGTPPPSPGEVEADLKNFDDFVKSLRERADKTGKAIGIQIEPPAAKISTQRAATVIDLTAV